MTKNIEVKKDGVVYVGRTLQERINRVDLTTINREALGGKLLSVTTLYVARAYAKALGLKGWTELRRQDLITFINSVIERLQDELAGAVFDYKDELHEWKQCGKELYEDDGEERLAVNNAARKVLDLLSNGSVDEDCPTAKMPEEFADRVAYALYISHADYVAPHVASLSGHDADYHFTIIRKGFAQLGIKPSERVGGVLWACE